MRGEEGGGEIAKEVVAVFFQGVMGNIDGPTAKLLGWNVEAATWWYATAVSWSHHSWMRCFRWRLIKARAGERFLSQLQADFLRLRRGETPNRLR